MGNADLVGHLFLGVLHAVQKSEAHLHDLLFPGGQPVHRRQQHVLLGVLLQLGADLVLVGAQHVGQKQLVALAVGVQRLVDAGLLAAVAALAKKHKYLVFDAAAGVGGQLDVLGGHKGVHRLDEPDGADGDDVLHGDAAALELARNIHHQPQVVGDEDVAAALPALFQPLKHQLFLFRGQRRRQGFRPADVVNAAGQPKPCQQAAQPGQQAAEQIQVHALDLLSVSSIRNSRPNRAWNCPSRKGSAVNTAVTF